MRGGSLISMGFLGHVLRVVSDDRVFYAAKALFRNRGGFAVV